MEPVAQPTGAESAHDTKLRARLESATPQERDELLRGLVLRRVAEILNRPAMTEDSNFLENGLTSLTALELAKQLMSDTELEVPLVAVVEHATSTLLGKYLTEAYEADLG
jgi:aryl carrier-like protein